jgi:hypothetical protein
MRILSAYTIAVTLSAAAVSDAQAAGCKAVVVDVGPGKTLSLVNIKREPVDELILGEVLFYDHTNGNWALVAKQGFAGRGPVGWVEDWRLGPPVSCPQTFLPPKQR